MDLCCFLSFLVWQFRSFQPLPRNCESVRTFTSDCCWQSGQLNCLGRACLVRNSMDIMDWSWHQHHQLDFRVSILINLILYILKMRPGCVGRERLNQHDSVPSISDDSDGSIRSQGEKHPRSMSVTFNQWSVLFQCTYFAAFAMFSIYLISCAAAHGQWKSHGLVPKKVAGDENIPVWRTPHTRAPGP